MNSHESSTTKTVPFKAWMGYIPRAHQPNPISNMPDLENKKRLLRTIWEGVQSAMAKAQKKWIKPTNYKPHQVGEKVWLDRKNLRTFHPNMKLCPKRFGPFAVTEKLGPTTYCLDLPAAWNIYNAFHGSLLEKYVETDEHGPNYDKPTPELVEGEPEYKVEMILDSQQKGRGHKLEYLVRWKGWGPAHDSWEPKENIHADNLVKEFYRQHPMSIRRVVIGPLNDSEFTFTTPPTPPPTPQAMPFHDFCEFDDRASQFYPRDQLPVPPLHLPSASPPPAPTHEFEPSKYQGPKPEPSWVNVKPWPDIIGTQNNHRPRAFLTTPLPDDSTSNQAVLSGTVRESASPGPPTMPPSVAAGLSDTPTELDLEAAAYVESAHPGALLRSNTLRCDLH